MAEPRYQTIARDLADRIATGHWDVGHNLPTEPELAAEYGVSRETLRAALRPLEQQGLISRGRGFPTRVRRREPTVPFAASLGTVDDLVQYGRTARRSILGTRTVTVDEELAARTGLHAGDVRVEVIAARDVDGRGGAASWAATYLSPADAAAIASDIDDGSTLLCDLIATRTGRRLEKVLQFARAVAVPDAARDVLGLEEGQPAMEFVRRYIDDRGDLFQVTISLHPGETFVYETSLERR